ncbi:MAG TPA: helix-turn-helix transcriptional regulator [Thermoanaerobaculia bacterium]|nr:helix-turn-helix transcriptional regulator [Thermoanaerobaculia bacterium]
MADLLATSMQVSGLSEEELERRLGWTSGSIGRILEGEEDLDPDEAIRVLSELNGDPGADAGPDFDDPEDGQTQVVTNLLERFHRLGYEAREMEAPEEDLDVSKLEKKIQAILREAFGKED